MTDEVSQDPAALVQRAASLRPIPRWVGAAFIFGGALMFPWIVYLALTLPVSYSAAHYSLAWVGFDIFVIALLLWTGLAAWRGNPRVATYAAMTATVLLVDAWFDITLSSDQGDLIQAVLLAILVEVPVAIGCLWVSLHASHVIGERFGLLREAWRSMRPPPEGGP